MLCVFAQEKTMIKVENISFAYDRGPAVLNDISIKIRKGEFVGILGQNGSGKTTLLKIMAGTLKPDMGTVIINGYKLETLNDNKRARFVAVVPQETSIPFPFSVMEMVLMGRAPYLSVFGFESQADIELAKKVMSELDVLKFANRSIYKLSGGEKQRVVIARALVQEPKILLLDEPTTFLDIRHQVELYQHIKKKNVEEGLTVLTVVHDINLASTFCDRIIFIKEGKVVADGTPHEAVTYTNVCNVFDTDVYVGINDITGMPYYVPYSNPSAAKDLNTG